MISEDDSDEDYSTVFNKKSKKRVSKRGKFQRKKSKAVEDILADSIDGSLEGIDATSISSRGEIRRSTRKRTPVIRDEFSLNESFVDEVLYYFPTSPTKYLNSSIVKRMRPTRTKVATTYNMDMVDEDDSNKDYSTVFYKEKKRSSNREKIMIVPTIYNMDMVSDDDRDEDYSNFVNRRAKKKGPNNKTKKKKDKTSKDIEDIFQDLIDGSLEIIRDDFSLNESLITEVRNNNYEVNSSEKLSNDIIPDIAFNGTPEICESAQESQDNAHSEDEIEIVGVKIRKKFTPKRVFNYIPPKQYEYNTYKS